MDNYDYYGKYDNKVTYDIAVIQIPADGKLFKIKHDQMIYDPYVRGIEQLNEAYSILQEYATGTGTLADFDF